MTTRKKLALRFFYRIYDLSNKVSTKWLRLIIFNTRLFLGNKRQWMKLLTRYQHRAVTMNFHVLERVHWWCRYHRTKALVDENAP